ncbi:MAG: gamma-glutamyltransferase [Saprospiraceae bacterium]
MKKNQLLLLGFILIISACRTNEQSVDYDIQKTAIEANSMVVSAHPEATKVGVAILKKGGNAVDAAIAVQLALAVVYPNAGNLGGGGFMIFRDKSGLVKTLDYREKAPLTATHDMYLDSLGEVTDKSVAGHLAAGVPGTVAGLFAAHQHAKLDFKELIQPAIVLAERGFKLTQQQANGLNEKRPDFVKHNTTQPILVKENDWQKDDLLIQKDLAETLKRIRDNGQKGFYEGQTADLIIKEMAAGGGIMTLEDLKKYKAKWRKPVSFDYKKYKVHSMAPPSSGGVALAQLLGSIEPYPIADWGFQSPKTVHLMVEAERRTYADRAKHLGDADFYDVPTASITQKEYIKARMSDFDESQATKSNDIEGGEVPTESEETTHLSIVDANGNAVSITTTLNSSFGSKVVVSGAGFLLNNEMDDFSAKPGVPNIYGLIGAEANAVAPEKRMLSSMTPTIIEREGKLFMVVGTPGGSTIITSVFQTFVNVAEFGMTMSEAVQAKRFHHQWLPEKVFYEKNALSSSLDSLQKMGHTLEERDAIGRVDAILVLENGQLEGAADTRGDDHAAGF